MTRKQEQPVHDPATYEALAVPVAPAAASAAIDAFLADVRELRAKHRIADVYVVAAVPIEGADGDRAMGFGHCGSSALLAAFDATAGAAGGKKR